MKDMTPPSRNLGLTDISAETDLADDGDRSNCPFRQYRKRLRSTSCAGWSGSPTRTRLVSDDDSRILSSLAPIGVAVETGGDVQYVIFETWWPISAA